MADIAYGRSLVVKRPEESGELIFRDEDLFIDVLNAHYGQNRILRTVNLPNNGQVNNLPYGSVLETTCSVSQNGFEPLNFGELPPGITSILLRILGTQALTVQAALQADRKLAIQALIAGETVKTEAEAEKVMDTILDTHRSYLPLFFD